MKKVLLALALIVFSSPVFAQATFPNSDKRIVDDEWCKSLAYVLKITARDFVKPLKYEFLDPKKIEADILLVRISHSSTIYKNLCMK